MLEAEIFWGETKDRLLDVIEVGKDWVSDPNFYGFAVFGGIASFMLSWMVPQSEIPKPFKPLIAISVIGVLGTITLAATGSFEWGMRLSGFASGFMVGLAAGQAMEKYYGVIIPEEAEAVEAE